MKSVTLHIFKKEFREMMRDKRVRSSAFFGPAFMMLLFLMMFGFVMSTVKDTKKQKIHVVKGNSDNFLVRQLEKSHSVQYVATMAEGEDLIRKGRARLVLNFPENLDQRVRGEKLSEITAAYDPKETLAPLLRAQVQESLNITNKQTIANVLTLKDIDPDKAEILRIKDQKIEVSKSDTSEFLIQLLPYLIVIWAFYGGFSIAADLVAGEKEKATLETLLITPARRTEIALGKFLALAAVCLLSSLASLFSVIIIGSLNLPATKALFEKGVGISPAAVGITFLVLLPTVALFASILVAFSTYARNVREAQTHLTLVSFAVLMPALFSQFIGFTEFAQSRWLNVVPVLNTATIIRQALMGKFDAINIAITMGVGIVLAIVGIYAAVKMFNREQVLVRV